MFKPIEELFFLWIFKEKSLTLFFFQISGNRNPKPKIQLWVLPQILANLSFKVVHNPRKFFEEWIVDMKGYFLRSFLVFFFTHNVLRPESKLYSGTVWKLKFKFSGTKDLKKGDEKYRAPCNLVFFY